jgi:alpha-methylacyl-CoA racemase
MRATGAHAEMSGPLAGLKVVEMPAIGPVPFAGMLLADLGADVLRLDREVDADLGVSLDARVDITARGKRSLAIDLKSPGAPERVLAIFAKADVVLEGFRAGTMEKLGLGPDVALGVNPALVYGRMTGWGQDGPLARTAGHDINYLALTGALHAIGKADEPPVPPLNLVADLGGGSLYLLMGVLAALYERQHSGRGQVVDAAMVDGASSLMSMTYALVAGNQWSDRRSTNLLDGGAPWYATYACADGKYIAIGALEAKFFREFMSVAGIDPARFPNHMDSRCWPEMRATLAQVFRTKTREEWTRLVGERDCCVAPVLSMSEAPHHPHMRARATFVERDGVPQPAPAPRFSRTPGSIRRGAPHRNEGGAQVLADWGVE